ncbi:MAG: HAMP domain-containing sensor histidine kinase [Patescibacteria group bacterium]|nr:HAMP domain-containing sensor histidine kinase [Patescibacteria group bacterium]MDD5715499.1 HAMP domain-containing sensor histidine kinase [Patescibacteria group bacterium]
MDRAMDEKKQTAAAGIERTPESESIDESEGVQSAAARYNEAVAAREVLRLGKEEKLKRLRWSVAVRYIMITVVCLISLLCYEFGFQFDLIGILIAATIAFIFNLTSSLVYSTIYYPKFWPYIGIFLDMIIISVIVHATGGIESVFLPLYILQLVGTNVHFSRIAGPLNLVFGGIVFTTIVVLEYRGILPHNAVGVLRETLYRNETYLFAVSITTLCLMGISTYRSGYVVRSLGTVEDELLKANQELARLNKIYSKVNRRLKEVDQMKTEFISVASHQMRTPLSATKWVLKMILDGDLGPLNDQQREMIGKGYETNERMIFLINDLLNVSRIEEGRFQYRFVHMSLEEVIESVRQEMMNVYAKRNIKLVYHKSGEPLPRVNIDPQKIHLVIQNLLDNAVKYTQSGGKVTTTLWAEENRVVCSIADNGVGIPPSQQGRIFSKFFRADNVIRMQTDGSGLGLFIVKNIIEKHRGEVWFESAEGKGTTFFFSLPIQQAENRGSSFEHFIKSM